jgi:hypothetical protein
MKRATEPRKKQGEFFDDFADDLRASQPASERTKKEQPSWLLEFLEQNIPTDHGRYSLEGHAPQRGIIELLEQVIVHRETESRIDVCKGEQLIITTTALGLALWAVAEHGYNVGYFLPDDKLASEFGMARLNPIIDSSEYLSTLMEDSAVDRGVLKRIGEKNLYLLGLAKIKGAASRPMDLQLSDEVDLTSEAVRKWKGGRMLHSKLRVEFDFSAPYRQDSGIDARFKEGSQRKWRVTCVACGKDDIVLEEIQDLRECFRNFNGTYVRVCPKCSRKLDVSKNGRWVAEYPEREKDRKYSFRLSAMATEAIDANKIMSDFLNSEDDPIARPIFDRTRRAIANAGAMQPFTSSVLRSMERDYTLKIQRSGNPIFCGGDVGNACWIWFEEWLPEGRARLLYAEKIHSDSYVDRSIALITKFQPRFSVFDKMPLFTDSRRIAYAFPRRVALLQFENGKEPYLIEERLQLEGTVGAARREYGPAYHCIKGDRNMILESFTIEATHADHGLIIPNERTPTMSTVHEHLKRLQKEIVHFANGNEVHQYLEHVDNHFGMSAAAARLARVFAPDVQPFAFTPVGGRRRSAGLRGALLRG